MAHSPFRRCPPRPRGRRSRSGRCPSSPPLCQFHRRGTGRFRTTESRVLGHSDRSPNPSFCRCPRRAICRSGAGTDGAADGSVERGRTRGPATPARHARATRVTEAGFAADLVQVVRGDAPRLRRSGTLLRQHPSYPRTAQPAASGLRTVRGASGERRPPREPAAQTCSFPMYLDVKSSAGGQRGTSSMAPTGSISPI